MLTIISNILTTVLTIIIILWCSSSTHVEVLIEWGPGKTFEDVEQYFDAARCYLTGYPTGLHWVDNFLLLNLLIHQFEHAGKEGDINLKLLTLKHMME